MGWASTPGLFRLFLAVLVLLSHATRLQLGKAAVLVFFVLSGYWITLMWLERYSKTRKPYFTYMVSRAWRLLPTFWLISLATWIWLYTTDQIPSGSELWEIIPNITLLGYNLVGFQAIGAAWSLDVEMQFYIIAPLIIAAAVAGAARYCWAVIAACILLSLLVWRDSQDILQCIGFFAIGMASAITKWRPSKSLAWGTVGVFLALLVGLIASPWRGIILGGRDPGELYLQYNMLAEVVFAMVVVPWSIYTTKQESNRFDHMLGDFSYIFYLIHMQILIVSGQANGSNIERVVKLIAATTVILALCWIIWRYFDKPINKMRAKWVHSRS